VSVRRDDIRALTEQRKRIHAKMLELNESAHKENRNLNSEEQESFDKMATEMEDLHDRETRAIRLFQQDRDVEHDVGSPLEKRIGDDGDAPKTYAEYRNAKNGGTPSYDLPEYRNAYFKFMQVGWHNMDIEEQRALSKASGAAGSFLVPTDFYDQIIRSLRFMGSVAQLATEIVTDSGDSIQVPANTAHGIAYWTAENAAVTPSDETFAQVTLGANKATSKVIVSEELLQDSAFDLDGFLATEFGERIGVLENTAYVVGDGSGKPTGLLQSSGTASNITTVTAATGNATAFSYSALVTGIFSLPPQYRNSGNCSWIVNDASARNLYLMLDSQNRPLWNVNVATTGPDTFLGYPIYTDPDVPAPGANNISALFGDWKRTYLVRRVRGFGMQRQNELHSDNGQVGFRGIDRVDGKVVLAAAGIALKHSAT
jgi:HK97 family phage major capsid protein